MSSHFEAVFIADKVPAFAIPCMLPFVMNAMSTRYLYTTPDHQITKKRYDIMANSQADFTALLVVSR